MFTNLGLSTSAGVAAALLIGVSIIPTLIVQFMGQKWRPSKPEDVVGKVRDREQGVVVQNGNGETTKT